MDEEPQKYEVVEAFETVLAKIDSCGEHLTDREWSDVDRKFHNSLQYVRHMPLKTTVFVAVWQMIVGTSALLGLLWVYPNTEVEGPWPRWFTRTTAGLFAAFLAAVMGSVIQTAAVLSLRAGKRTLERGYEPWYVVRPLIAGLLGTLASVAVLGGFLEGIGITIGKSGAGFVGIGALAGLFTDSMLQKFQRLFGASNPDDPASSQKTPGVPPEPSPT